MGRIHDIKKFANSLPIERPSKTVSIDAIIDVLIEDVRTGIGGGKDLTLEDIDKSVSRLEIRRRNGPSMSMRWGGALGHGPLTPWIPHTCHKTIELCFPGPEDSDIEEICMEIEFPWPCNPPWPLPGPD